jgi:hypothetical protein
MKTMGGSVADKIDYTGAPEIGPKLNLGGGYSINSSPQSFGSDLFSAIHGLGQVGEEAALRRQKLANDIKANDLSLDTSQKYNEEWEKMNAKQGLAAHEYLPTYLSNLRKIHDDTVKNAPNDAIRERVAAASFRDADRWMGHGTNYAGTQLRQAHKETHARSVDSNINQIEMNRNQPIEVLEDMARHGHNGIGGEDSVMEQLFSHGLTPDKNPGDYEDAIQKHWGMALAPTIKALADNGEANHADLRKAKELFDRNRDKMDARTANVLDQMLKPKIDKLWVQEQADREKPIPDEQGYFPTTKAEMKRFGVLEDERPTRANASALGILRGQPAATGRHASDYFAHLERGDRDVGYIQTNDTHGSRSYGSNGLNTWTHGGDIWGTSAGRFWKRYGTQLGLDGVPGQPSGDAAWRRVAEKNPDQLRAAERDWWTKENYDPVQPKLTSLGAPASITNDPTVKLYFADRNVQQGPGKMEDHKDRITHALTMSGGNPVLFIRSMNAQDAAHIQGDYHTYLSDIERQSGPEARARAAEGLAGRITGRHEAAVKAAGEGGAPAPTTEPQPAEPRDSVVSPGYTAREAHRQSNLIRAHALAGGDPAREHMLYSEFNRRDALVKTNLTGQRQVVQDTVKNLDLMASKGLPGATLEKAGLSEDYIRSLWLDKPHIAEHIIENNRLQSQVADKLSSMKFAPKEEWDRFLVSTNQGLGIDTMIQQHRKKSGTTSAFELGANPEASAEIMSNNFALREKLATTVRKAYDDRQIELGKDPANFLVTSGNPAILKAIQEFRGAKDIGETQSAFRKYAALQTSMQKELGVPPDKIRVLSVAKAEEQTKAIMNSSDPKAEIDKMKATYGDLYPAVFRDVVALGKLPSKFESLSHIDAQNADILSGMIKSEAEAKPNEHRRMMEGLLGKDRSVVVNAVRIGAADLMDSMVARRMTDPECKEKLDTITLLAEGRMRKFHETAAAASDEAVKAFTKDYKFVDRIAIPASKYQGVMAERKDRVRFLSPDNIIIPESIKSQVGSEADYVKAVQTGGSWVSTKEGDGMFLVDHWGNPVMTMSPSVSRYNDEAGTEKVIPGKPVPVKIMYDQTYGSISNIPGREANYKGR